MAASTDQELFASTPPYAPGSAEAGWLRNHSTYLVPDLTVKLRLGLNLFYGMLSNLSILWLSLFVLARPLGWAYRWAQPGLLTRADPSYGVSTWVLVLLGALVTLSFGAVYAERILDRFQEPWPRTTAFLRAWSTRLLLLLAGAVVLLVLTPALVLALWELGRSDAMGGAAQTSMTRLGFSGDRGGSLRLQLPAVLATVAATVGVVTRTVQTASHVVGNRFGRAVLPWLASGLVSLLLVLPFLKWTKDAVLATSWPRELALTGAALAAVLLHELLTNINRTSMHPFYKERLCSAFATHRISPTQACELPYSVPVRLSTLDTHGTVPELLVCAAGNVSGLDDVPPGRGCVSFVFSRQKCGAPALGPLVDTARYERVVGARTLTVPGAVAISGAAISPVMGRETRPALRLLLTVANVRLGMWLPNPARPETWPRDEPAVRHPLWSPRRLTAALARRRAEPGPRYLVREMFGRNRWDDHWLYVSDGGHWENLGLLELLRRGCTTVWCLDGSGDSADSSATLGQAIAMARSELGVEIALDPSAMATDPTTGWARNDHAVGTITYPDGRVGVLGVAKLAVTDDAPWDVRAYKLKDPRFPYHSTMDQLYDDQRFEAYRSLGRHTATRLLAAMDRQEQARSREALRVGPALGRPGAGVAGRIDLTGPAAPAAGTGTAGAGSLG